jgi:hypothetical protein
MIFKQRFDLVLVTTLLLGALAVSACGGDPCEDYCEGAQGCENAEFAQGAECVSSCKAAIDQVEAEQGCGEEFEDLLQCAGDADDTCNPQECVSEALAVLQCSGYTND